MRLPTLVSLSAFALCAAPGAFAQDRVDPPPLDVRVAPLDQDFAKIDVVKLDGDLGDVVIVVCGLPQVGDVLEPVDPFDLEPVMVLDARDPRLQFLKIEPVQLEKLPIAMFAVAMDRTGDVHFSPVKTAKQLAKELEASRDAPLPGDVSGSGQTELPELTIEVISTDGIPPEFGLGIRTWVHPPGQELVVDAVNHGDWEDDASGIDVYLTIQERKGSGKEPESVGEELRAFAPLGYASGSQCRVWLRRIEGCVVGEYALAAELLIEE